MEAHRRIGRVEVAAGLCRAEGFDPAVTLMQSVMTVFQTDYDWGRDIITFTGISRFFDPVAPGCMVPTYKFVVGPRGIHFE